MLIKSDLRTIFSGMLGNLNGGSSWWWTTSRSGSKSSDHWKTVDLPMHREKPSEILLSISWQHSISRLGMYYAIGISPHSELAKENLHYPEIFRGKLTLPTRFGTANTRASTSTEKVSFRIFSRKHKKIFDFYSFSYNLGGRLLRIII